MFEKRINIFMGHYGSGKTFTAVNYSIALAKLGKKVSIYDLDIVNPYFRTVDAEKTLQDSGVELVVSPYAETNVDIPAMNAKSYQMLDDLSRFAVLDIGGDDRGALALGRFRDGIINGNDYECYFVVNKFRPETRTIEDAIAMKNDIENSGKLPFTAIVNNGNLGVETNKQNILDGLKFCEELSKKTGLPVKFTSIREDLIDENIKEKIKDILPVKPIKYGNW